MIRAKEKAEEMNRLKTNFLNNMSHELRTPLVAILGYSDFLSKEVHSMEQEEMLQGIASGGQRLLQTINSLLDFSRIASKKIESKLTEVDFNKEAEQIINTLSILAEKKNLYLHLVKKAENVVSLVDLKSFVQILENIIGNAIKFTSNGGVTVEIDKNDQDGESWSVFRVLDTGVGITKDSLEIIFEEFRQASEGLTRKYEGTGLGLAITKKLVDIMNGKIIAESEPGKGSIFTIMFKSVIPGSNKINGEGQNKLEEDSLFQTMPEDKIFTGRKILAVEDDFISRDVLRLCLRNLFKVEFAENGESALQMIMHKKYNAVLMDMNLGKGMNGLDAIQKIKKIEGYKNVPIIAVTAYAMEGDREKFLNNGCAYYISKPFEKKAIIELLNTALNAEVSKLNQTI